jgi:hypothetical protein
MERKRKPENWKEVIFFKTLTIMPNTFTSKKFGSKARMFFGADSKTTRSGALAEFLNDYCFKTNPSSRTWTKKTAPKQMPIFKEETKKLFDLKQPQRSNAEIQNEINGAIILLKQNGFKVMKPETTYSEI